MSGLLLTGGTGTFGQAYARRALADGRWDRIVVLSRDEVKQAEMADAHRDAAPLKLFLGDVRDSQRLALAMRGIEVVVHAAALKRIDAGTYSPSEMIVTNVLGTMNVVNAAIQAGVRRVVVISSDKSCAPVNLYGGTKFCAESYAVHANTYGYPSGTRIAAVRYGNVLWSRGSVLHRWRAQMRAGDPLTLTHDGMTRFVMSVAQAAALVDFAIDRMKGGEVFVPILPTARMIDMARAVSPPDGYPIHVRGLRPGGEKMAEALLNEEEPCRTRAVADNYLAIVPGHHEWTNQDRWTGVPIDPAVVYRSDNPGPLGNRQLSVNELRDIIRQTEAP